MTNYIVDCDSGVWLDIDISDHLLIFSVCGNSFNTKNAEKFTYIRKIRLENLDQFKEKISGETWFEVFNKANVNEAYLCFWNRFLKLLGTCCPIEGRSSIKRDKLRPWLIKGLVKVSKRTNTSYKKFLRHRRARNERKYKHCKNNLTRILRKCKKNYFEKFLLDFQGVLRIHGKH